MPKFLGLQPNITLVILYFFANIFYLIKYGARQEYIPVYILIALYLVIGLVALRVVKYFESKINKSRYFNTLFLSFGLLIFFALVILVLNVDESSLKVLRWKGMYTTISHVLEGNYPYTTFLDAKGDTTSNLPALFYIGLPFYLLGDVGLLQPFVFLLLFVVVYKSNLTNYIKVLMISLLVFSPAFLWEVAAKSDLMSNMVLVSLFILWWKSKWKNDMFKKPVLLSFFIAFFLLTRLFVVIPFVILFFSSFFKIEMKKKLWFIVGLLFFLGLISLPVLITIPDLDTAIKFNPLNNQTGEAPWYLSILFLSLSVIFSYVHSSLNQFFKLFLLLTFFLVLSRFFINVIEEGWQQNMFGSLFDISYFGLIIPLVLFSIFTEEKNTMHA
ncbi:hypothetical protein ACFSRZ_15420 [Pseudotenacibaculum haliotis]|uniref:Glycosyltransferase RgtA/B/C/D-like domain-containing protein n=2 Tax=Pseudotenacibaculum haliotis TaxID=1862138 RepID=A0ABW5LVZ0_9FLAO